MSTPDIITRSEWGARYGNGFGLRTVGDLDVYLHHSVTIAPDLLPPFTDDYAAVRTLESIGQSRFGHGISYQFPITPVGLVFEGVGIDRVGAAIAGHNTKTANIVLVGNYDKATPPRPMLEAVDGLLRLGVTRGWWKHARLAGGHRDAPGASTACPGRYAYDLIDDINAGKYRADPGAVEVSNPITPKPPRPSNPGKGRLKVDGFWGTSTTRRLQKVLGTPQDGVVSSQNRVWRDDNPGLTLGWQWVPNPRGSRVIAALQDVLGVETDGILGPDSIRALQRRMGTPVDGVLSRESRAIMALQRRLNDGKV